MKRVKQVLTRFATMFLALICVIGMGTPVFAVDDFTSKTTRDFTVTGFETASDKLEAYAYQIITVNVNDEAFQPEFPMYEWASESLKSWVTTYDSNNSTDYIDENGMVTENFKGLSAENQTKFLEQLTLAIKDNTVTGLTPTNGRINTGTATFSDMKMGEYLITANGGINIYSPTTVKLLPVYDSENKVWELGDPDIGVNAPESEVPNTAIKSQTPSITKTVSDPTDRTVSIGDTVTYSLEVLIPDYPTDASAASLTVFDNLGAGLTLVKPESEQAITVKNSEGNIVTAGDDTYSVTDNPSDGKAFELVFDRDYVLQNGGKKLNVSYEAVVNETANNSDYILANTASISYSTDPYNNVPYTADSAQNVYTYKTVISKYNSEGTLLTGAQFKLTKTVNNASEPMYFKASTTEKTNTYTYNSSKTSADTDYIDTLTVGNDGNLTIVGLDEGTYTLTETKAPGENYALPKGTITFTLANDDSNAAILGTNTKVSTKSSDMLLYVDDSIQDDKGFSTDGDTLTIKVLNLKKDEANFTLPSTGGMGTILFTVGGLFVMAGAVVLAVVMYKKKNA